MMTFLADPVSYPHRPEKVQLLQTHTAYVALALPFAYKVKKPVNFGFLDFSSLEQRQHYCELELQLNRRLCSGIYEVVVPIFRRGDRLSFAGGDEIIDYAIKMHALTKGQFLDERIRQGQADKCDIDRIVEKLEAFYKGQTPRAAIAEWGYIDKLKFSTDENFEQTTTVVGSLVSEAAFEAIRYFTNRFYEQNALLLNRRRAEGHILDCHGDLHTHHIFLGDDVCIYDCIEFSERLRYLDVANDLAFLAMDLDYHGRPDLAHYFVKRMVEALADEEILNLIDFYKCYRAYVRAKVEGMRSEQAEVPAADREQSQARAKRYYQEALRYAVVGSKPAVIVVMGQVGTGKTTQAEALAQALGWNSISSDKIRKKRAGVPLYYRGSIEERRELYASAMTKSVYATMLEQALEALHSGQGIILDATYGNPTYRTELREALQQDIPCIFIELTAEQQTIKARLQEREQKKDIISDARLEDFEVISQHYEAPNALEDMRHLIVHTDKSSEATTTLRILKQLINLT